MAITERSEQNGEAKLTYTDVSRHSTVFFSCSPILEPVDVDLSDLSVFTPKPKGMPVTFERFGVRTSMGRVAGNSPLWSHRRGAAGTTPPRYPTPLLPAPDSTGC